MVPKPKVLIATTEVKIKEVDRIIDGLILEQEANANKARIDRMIRERRDKIDSLEREIAAIQKLHEEAPGKLAELRAGKHKHAQVAVNHAMRHEIKKLQQLQEKLKAAGVIA